MKELKISKIWPILRNRALASYLSQLFKCATSCARKPSCLDFDQFTATGLYPGFHGELDEDSEPSYIGPNSTTTAWGMSYDWSELPDDIHNMTGIDIDQIMLDLEDAALDGHINLDLSYGINGTTYYYVVQNQGQSTEIELAGSGGDVDVDVKETTITLRMAVESTMGIDFDWAEDDVGFDVDMDSQANNAIIIDIEMREYYTTDDYRFAGMDVNVSGGLSYSTGMGLTADIYAGNDHYIR